MEVRVRPFGALRRCLPKGEREMAAALPEGATLAELLESLGIAPGEVGVAAVGGESVWMDRVLSHGDLVELFNVVCGGE